MGCRGQRGRSVSFWICSEGGVYKGSVAVGGEGHRDLRWLLGVESDLQRTASGEMGPSDWQPPGTERC